MKFLRDASIPRSFSFYNAHAHRGTNGYMECNLTRVELFHGLNIDSICPKCQSPVFLHSNAPAPSPAVVQESPIGKFQRLLPDVFKPVHPETIRIIYKYFSSWLMVISDESSAIDLFQQADQRPHESTKIRIRDTFGFLINGPFLQNASSKAILHLAFVKSTLAPLLIKFGRDVTVDFRIFERLNLTQEESLANHIVPILSRVHEIGRFQGLVMPLFSSGLHEIQIGLIPHATLLNGCRQMKVALDVLHVNNVFHNDVKPQNILLDPAGNWLLCDFGSCSCEGLRSSTEVSYTASFIPINYAKLKGRRCCREFDYLLLVSTIAHLAGLKLEFTYARLIEFISELENEELKEFLLTLTPRIEKMNDKFQNEK